MEGYSFKQYLRQSLKECSGLFCLAALLMLPVTAMAAADDDAKSSATESQSKEEPAFFAKVGDQTLAVQDYYARLAYAIRQKFFHAKVPEKEMQEFRKQVGEQFVNRVLLIREAKKRGIKPDAEAVNNKIKRLESKRVDDKYWQENREKLVVGVREEYEHDSLLKRLEAKVRKVADPDEKEMRAYFKANPDKFVIPERLRLANILLKVDPSSGSDVWRAATDEAFAIVEKIRKGAKFDEMARIHSSADSAAQGGDMGYVHKGMLAKPAQNIIDLMDEGDISEPIILLQGVAIFRLEERVKTKANIYDRVKETIKGLVMRDKGEKAWNKLFDEMRKKVKIEINESVYEK